MEEPHALPKPNFVDRLFDDLAPHYDAAVWVGTLGQDLRWKHALARAVRPRPGERALDLACGTGLVTGRLARAIGRRDRVVGLDRNPEMLRGARARDRAIPWVRASAIALPFRAGSMDVVTAAYLPKYVSRTRLASEARRVLRPGGRIAVYDFARPRAGPAGRAYRLFMRFALPRIGRLVGASAPRWRALSAFLDDIARGSDWEDELVAELRDRGFERVARRVSLGGASARVSAWLPPTEEGLVYASAPAPQRV